MIVSDLLTHIERSVMVDVDLDKPLACGSRMHAVPDAQPAHGGEVTHWVVNPCGCNGLRCETFVSQVRSMRWRLTCKSCGAKYSSSRIVFIEL